MKIYIYTPNPVIRLKYAAGFIFRDVWETGFEIVSDPSRLQGNTCIINYSKENIPAGIWIYPSGLMEETGIRKLDIEITRENGISCLFPTSKGDLPFDIFSSVFYMLSRYEEYLPSEKDQYGRFKVTSSLAWKENFLEQAVVNQWLAMFSGLVKERFPNITIPPLKSQYIPTVDIDNPWAYLHKPFIRFAGGLVKDLVFFRRRNLLKRMLVLSGRRKDPYDSYDYLVKFHNKKLRMFLLMGSKDKHDNKIPASNSYWKELIARLSTKFSIGLHPSFKSHKSIKYLVQEKQTLEEILGEEITMSRQHFLKLEIPCTYRNLISLGIKEDYSMGFAELTGFRAGTSYSFNFYDLEKEEESSLRIFPFTVMDRSLKDYMKLDQEEAKAKISSLITHIKKFGGNFVSVWHNEALGESDEWRGWIDVYEHMQKEVEALLPAEN
jgi:hypothetical protein